ncbi:hypothetical protein EIP91_002846 [Steccherinum ochraceum]|uniref:NAD(P)-binding protein n=1 Tax=Steccherinum ochraceum TaxID=92696 RepID=A0A4R0RS38_9APHY|nr:hypothetical protein EIP91_002846 [Steccherinum ochraceum]
MSQAEQIGDYTPNVAVVTGAARGIGRAIALRLADDGFDVAVNDISSSKSALEDVKNLIESKGKNAIAVTGDVSVEADVENLIAETVKVLGGIDVMVANAGVASGGKFLDLDISSFDRVISINLRGVMLCYLLAARQMVKQKRGGRLIGASSVFGKRGVAYNQAYCASKFAVRGLTQSVAKEVRHQKITCNSYAPGLILTDMTVIEEDKLIDGQPGSFVKSLIGHHDDQGTTITICGGMVME